MQISSISKECSSICKRVEYLKRNNLPDIKLNNEKCQNTLQSRYKSFGKSRQPKMKIHHTYGNHHRLDHTYAATANFNDILRLKPIEQNTKYLIKETARNCLKNKNWFCSLHKKIMPITETSHQEMYISEKNENIEEHCNKLLFNSARDECEEISLKSSWLRNLCLEYQPMKNTPTSHLQNMSFSDDILKDKHRHLHFSSMNGTPKQYTRNGRVNKNKAEFLGKTKIIKSVQEDKKRWIAAVALIELAQSK